MVREDAACGSSVIGGDKENNADAERHLGGGGWWWGGNTGVAQRGSLEVVR